MSQHAVKLDFLRRVHRKSAPNRRSAHQHPKKTLKVSLSLPAATSHTCVFAFLTLLLWAQVPDAIKSQYQNPPPTLLPAGVRQLELVCSGVPDCQASRHLTTEAEQEEVLTAERFRCCEWLIFPRLPTASRFWCSPVASGRDRAPVQHHAAPVCQTELLHAAGGLGL